MTRTTLDALEPRSPLTGLPRRLAPPSAWRHDTAAYLRSLPPAAQLALLRLTALS